jgi:hypothetical protein
MQPVGGVQLPVAQAVDAATQSVELEMPPAPSQTTHEAPTQVLVPGVQALQVADETLQP